MAGQQPIRVVVEKQRSGCGTALGILLLVGLAVEYWYVSLAILAIVACVAVVRASQERKKARHRPGPRDPWLNEIAVALADLGLTEIARNTGAQLGGVPIDGDIGIETNRLRVYVTLFSNQLRARQAELGLRANPKIRTALANGATAITTADRVVFVANGRGTVVDEFRLEEIIRVVGRIAVPVALTGVAAPPVGSGRVVAPEVAGAITLPNADALEQLRKLGDLRAAGVLTDAEFEAKKTELLGRL